MFKTRLATALAVIPLGAALAVSAQSTPATLTINMQKPIAKVSPTLYGLMTEEINYSYDGGLYAEMVRNRALTDNNREPSHWYLVEDGDSKAAISIDRLTGPSEALDRSLEVNVEKADPQDQAGVLNEGYWGMAVRPDTVYHGSFYARAAAADMGPVTVRLVDNNTGKAVATATVRELTTTWQKHEFTLKTASDVQPSAANHLAITVGHPGTMWLELVSVFPPTYKDTPNGNRADLMEKLAAMHPTFLRLPGGNFLEGDLVSERYDWKTTIGPLVDRPTHPSPWGYQSTDGLGLLEFLEWCEDLKIQPVLAVYAGYSLKQDHVAPGPALQPYVQDALDEIEYVSGSTSTKWGAVRAKDGHAKPFPLTYVEIGNEDWFDRSGSYDGRYAQFYKAIKQKYPQLQLIATTPVKSVRPDVIDDHYYRRATEFYSDVNHYDKTDRNGPKIFVGEWATREGSPTPNFGAALGDAAWMTGMERNSDVIVMASYAPLLTNVNPGGMQWETDLIGYDALNSYGSPSYYAQAMFAGHIGTEVLASQMANANPHVFYSVTANPAKGMMYLKLVNATSKPQPVEVKLDGGRPASTGTLISLNAHSTQETNTITDPKRIAPVESQISGLGTNFSHTVPAYSIEVLELRTK